MSRTNLSQSSTSSKLYTEYLKAVVEEECSAAQLAMATAQQKRFEAMEAKSKGANEEFDWDTGLLLA